MFNLEWVFQLAVGYWRFFLFLPSIDIRFLRFSFSSPVYFAVIRGLMALLLLGAFGEKEVFALSLKSAIDRVIPGPQCSIVLASAKRNQAEDASKPSLGQPREQPLSQTTSVQNHSAEQIDRVVTLLSQLLLANEPSAPVRPEGQSSDQLRPSESSSAVGPTNIADIADVTVGASRILDESGVRVLQNRLATLEGNSNSDNAPLQWSMRIPLGESGSVKSEGTDVGDMNPSPRNPAASSTSENKSSWGVLRAVGEVGIFITSLKGIDELLRSQVVTFCLEKVDQCIHYTSHLASAMDYLANTSWQPSIHGPPELLLAAGLVYLTFKRVTKSSPNDLSGPESVSASGKVGTESAVTADTPSQMDALRAIFSNVVGHEGSLELAPGSGGVAMTIGYSYRPEAGGVKNGDSSMTNSPISMQLTVVVRPHGQLTPGGDRGNGEVWLINERTDHSTSDDASEGAPANP